MEDLCKRLLDAKQKESFAKNERIAIEKEIISALDLPNEGTLTEHDGSFKISVTTKLSRKLNWDKYQALSLPDNISFVDLKPSINLKRMRAVEMIDPDLVYSVITTKPSKPSIKIVEVL